MKIRYTSAINPFGGINLVINQMDKLGIGSHLNNNLPKLPAQSRYDWREIFYSLWSVFYCGGGCAEDLTAHLAEAFRENPLMSAPSPDRLLTRLKSIAPPIETAITKRSTKNHQYCHSDILSKLLLEVSNNFGCYKGSKMILDYDNTPLLNNKKDARNTYLKAYGYQPGVAFLNGKVAYVENRNGNSPAHSFQAQTMERMFQHLSSVGIKPTDFRADSASYISDVVDQVEKNCDRFFIRVRLSSRTDQAIASIKEWKPVPGTDRLRGECSFKPFERALQDGSGRKPKTYRLIVTKMPRNDGQLNVITGEAFRYYAILTNEMNMTAHQVTLFYNARGAVEREFDVLKNDFGWKKLPFSYLNENLVYMIVMALCRNIYACLIRKIAKSFKGLVPSDRLKKFIFRYISVPAKWIRKARTHWLIMYRSTIMQT